MSYQPYRDFRKKDKAPSPGPGVGTPTKRAVGRVNRFGVTSFTSIREGNAAANGNNDAYSFEDEAKPGKHFRPVANRIGLPESFSQLRNPDWVVGSAGD